MKKIVFLGIIAIMTCASCTKTKKPVTQAVTYHQDSPPPIPVKLVCNIKPKQDQKNHRYYYWTINTKGKEKKISKKGYYYASNFFLQNVYTKTRRNKDSITSVKVIALVQEEKNSPWLAINTDQKSAGLAVK